MTDTAHCPLRLFDERAAERGSGRGGRGEEGSKEVGEAKTKQGGEEEVVYGGRKNET